MIVIAVKMIFFDKEKKENGSSDNKQSFVENTVAGNDS